MRRAIGAAVAAVALSCAGSANAAMITATYTGTALVGDIRDFTGVFGAVGPNAFEYSAEAVFVYDTNKGVLETGGEYARYYGPNLLQDAWLAINGVRIDFPNAVRGQMYNEGGVNAEHSAYSVPAGGTSMFGVVYSQLVNINPIKPLDTDKTFASFVQFGINDGSDRAEGVFRVNHVTITGVPEPATWAMMIIGFGAVGGALRSTRLRRREFA